MAAPAEVSEKRSNFRIRQFKKKRHFNIAANLTLNTMASFVILLIARTARIACSDGHTYIQTDRHTHTHTRDNYCNPLCACGRGLIMMIIDVCFTLIFILYHQFCCVKLIVAIVLCLIVIDMTNRIVLCS